MSNLWKLYGLAYSRKDFFDEAQALIKQLGNRSFDNKTYQAKLVDVDKFCFRWHCPLGHLEAQLFYDLLCCQTLWNNFAKVLEISGLDTSKIHPGDADASVFWQVLGLACLDPWKNKNADGTNHPGFRHLLQQNIGAADQYGFKLTADYKQMIAVMLAKPQILDALQGIAMCWDPQSEAMLLNRDEYARLQPIELPPGWLDLTKP